MEALFEFIGNIIRFLKSDPGLIYVGGLIATTMAKNPWTWRGMEGIAGKVIAQLFWPVWFVFDLIRIVKGDKPAGGVSDTLGCVGLPLLSIWAGQLWVIPALTAAAAVVFFLFALRSSRSGAYKYKYHQDRPREYIDLGKRLSLTKVPQFWFAVCMAVATLAIVVWVNLEQ